VEEKARGPERKPVPDWQLHQSAGVERQRLFWSLRINPDAQLYRSDSFEKLNYEWNQFGYGYPAYVGNRPELGWLQPGSSAGGPVAIGGEPTDS